MPTETTTFFVDIDTQNDFMNETGALYIPGASNLKPYLQKLTEYAKKNGITIISSTDAHSKNDPEFQDFPPHCVIGEEGQKKISETLLEKYYVVPHEKQEIDFISIVREYPQIIFEKLTFDILTNKNIGSFLQILQNPLFILYGVATDFCVKATALGLRKKGYPVKLVEDAVKGITEERTKKAFLEMKTAGVSFVSLQEVIE